MPIHHAVLALLAESPSYGYELKSKLERAVGPQFGNLNIGHLYQVLERLERDRLVTRRVVEQTAKPDKAVYRLTKEGRSELMDWVATPYVRTSGYRDDFFLKLVAAARLGAEHLDRLLDVQRRAYLKELAALGEARARAPDDAIVRLLIEAATLHTRADLSVVEAAEGLRDAMGRSAEAGADERLATGASDFNRRGRPASSS